MNNNSQLSPNGSPIIYQTRAELIQKLLQNVNSDETHSSSSAASSDTNASGYSSVESASKLQSSRKSDSNHSNSKYRQWNDAEDMIEVCFIYLFIMIVIPFRTI
jgi:hypothetical protein